MSGVEVAGLILKTFPTLLKAANELYPIFEGCKEWWDFDVRYRGFIDEIDTERMFYQQQLAALLQPLDLDLEKHESLESNPDSPLWYAIGTRDKLKEHIGAKKWVWFMKQIETMNRTLESLHQLLPRIDGKLQTLQPGRVEDELKRFKICFGKDKPFLLEELRATNANIGVFVRNEAAVHHPVNNKRIVIARKLQLCAKVLSDILQTQLSCNAANHAHEVAVAGPLTDKTSDKANATVRLLTGGKNNRLHLTCSVESVDRAAASPAQKTSTSPGREEELTTYMRDLRLRAWREQVVAAADNHEPRLVAVAAVSTAIDPRGSHTQDLWKKRMTARLRKGSKRLGLWRGKDGAQNQGLATGAHDRNTQNGTNDKTAIVGASSFEPAPTAEDTVSGGAHVRFAPLACPQAEDSDPDSIAISDFCSFLGCLPHDASHQHFVHGDNRLDFRPNQPGQAVLEQPVLEKRPERTVIARTLRERLNIAAQVALVVVKFGASGWVPQGWGHNDIFILQHTDGRGEVTSTPFLCHRPLVLQTGHVLSQSSTDQVPELLRNLGVFLLELMSQQTIEETAHWRQYSPDGKANNITRLCSAIAWQDEFARGQLPFISDPIANCLTRQYSKTASCHDREFLKWYLETVVGPLENAIASYDKGAPVAS